jgi:hypothetical protein
MSSTVESLRETLEQFLTDANIPFRDRGERLSVRRGSTAVFIRPKRLADEHTVVELLCPVLSDVPVSEALLLRLNEVNMSLYFGKAYWHERAIWLAHNLLGDRVDSGELLAALGLLATVADRLDDDLQESFGGTRWIDSAS